jgi:hypothetical protein
MVDLHEYFRDHGGQHGQESEEGKEGKEDNQKEKEVTVRPESHNTRIAAEIRYALGSADRRQLSPAEYPSHKPSGRPLVQIAAA